MRMAFMDEESLKILAEDGEIRGAIGESYEFRGFKVKGFDTLYQVDISEMGDENPVLETYILQKHSSKIPWGMPGGSKKVYRMEVPSYTRENGYFSSKGKKPTDGLELIMSM